MLVILASKFHPFIRRARRLSSSSFQLLRCPHVIPRPDGMCNPNSEFWVYPRVLSQLDVSENPTKEVAWEASWSSARTTSIVVFCRGGATGPLRATYPVSEAEPRLPAEEPIQLPVPTSSFLWSCLIHFFHILHWTSASHPPWVHLYAECRTGATACPLVSDYRPQLTNQKERRVEEWWSLYRQFGQIREE